LASKQSRWLGTAVARPRRRLFAYLKDQAASKAGTASKYLIQMGEIHLSLTGCSVMPASVVFKPPAMRETARTHPRCIRRSRAHLAARVSRAERQQESDEFALAVGVGLVEDVLQVGANRLIGHR
jgi:hypothetical protein